MEESKDEKRQKRKKSKKSRATKKDQAAQLEPMQKQLKRSQTLRVVSYIKIDVPGQPSRMQKVVKKRRIRGMSERKFGIWSQKKSGDQSANKMGIVDECGDDEADSWQ